MPNERSETIFDILFYRITQMIVFLKGASGKKKKRLQSFCSSQYIKFD